MFAKGKPDYEYEEKGVNYRVYYLEDKVVIKAKQGDFMVI